MFPNASSNKPPLAATTNSMTTNGAMIHSSSLPIAPKPIQPFTRVARSNAIPTAIWTSADVPLNHAVMAFSRMMKNAMEINSHPNGIHAPKYPPSLVVARSIVSTAKSIPPTAPLNVAMACSMITNGAIKPNLIPLQAPVMTGSMVQLVHSHAPAHVKSIQAVVLHLRQHIAVMVFSIPVQKNATAAT